MRREDGRRFRQSLGHRGKNIRQTTHWRVSLPVSPEVPAWPAAKPRNRAVFRSECAVYMVGAAEKSADLALAAGAPQP